MEQQMVLDSLTDHMAVYNCSSKQRSRSVASGSKRARHKVLQWLKGLGLRQRQAALTIVDARWVSLLLEMQRHLEEQGPCTFFFMSDFERSGANPASGLCFRRAKGLMRRLPAQADAGAQLASSLVLFSSLDGSSLDSVSLSYDFIQDVDRAVEVLDEITYGEFLQDQCCIAGSSSWQETAWLSSMGYYSMAAFVANRLEFAIWAAWISSLGNRHPLKTVPKTLARSATDAALVSSSACIKRQCFEDWWNKLTVQDRNRILTCVIAKVSKTEACKILKIRLSSKETSSFSRVSEALEFLEAIGDMQVTALVDNGRRLACTSLASAHSHSERVLRSIRKILLKVMTDNTEQDLLDFDSTNRSKRHPKGRKGRNKKNAQTLPAVCDTENVIDGDTEAQAASARRRKKKNKRKEVPKTDTKDAPGSDNRLVEDADHKAEPPLPASDNDTTRSAAEPRNVTPPAVVIPYPIQEDPRIVFGSVNDGLGEDDHLCEIFEEGLQVSNNDDYNQIFGGGVMYWNAADYAGMGYSRPGSQTSEDSSWARREADMTLVVDDIVGLPPIATPYAGLSSGPPSLACTPPSLSTPLSFPFDNEVQRNGLTLDTKELCSSQPPALAPILVRKPKVFGQFQFSKLQEARSPHVPRGRKDSLRWKRSPSPVLRCLPSAPPPPPPSPVNGVKKRRGFATVRSGSSSPRHWGVIARPDSHELLKAFSPEGTLSWRSKSISMYSLPGRALPDTIPPPVFLHFDDCSKMQSGLNRLHREIESFCLQVAAEKALRKPFVNAAIKKVAHALQVLWPRSRIKIFGSVATGLALPNSDVDLVVCLPPVRNLEPIKEAGILEGRNGIKETCLQHASRYLAYQEWVKSDSLKAIENTAIPVIMLAAKCPLDNLPAAKGKATDNPERTPWGTAEDREVVRLDISFESPSHTGLPTAELVKTLVSKFPPISLLALVLKQFLMDKGLDQPYTGGLSSYCLVLLITRYLQHRHQLGFPSQNQNLGSLLMEFLDFYGKFDPREMGVSIIGEGMYLKRGERDRIDPLYIEDPLHPMNNVGRNCFRILQCTKAFVDAYTALDTELSCLMERSTTSVSKDFLLLHKLLPSIAEDG